MDNERSIAVVDDTEKKIGLDLANAGEFLDSQAKAQDGKIDKKLAIEIAKKKLAKKMAKIGALPGAKFWDAAKSGTFAFRTSEFKSKACVGKDLSKNRAERRKG